MPKPVLLQFTVDSQLMIVGHFSQVVHLQRVRAGLRITRDSRRSTSPTSVEIAITFYTTRRSHLHYGSCEAGFTRYPRFTSSDATDGSSNRNYLLQDSTELSTLRMMLVVYCFGYGSLTRLYMDQWTQFKIVEQRSQIVPQLWMGSIITPNVLKWLPDAIRYYYCQLSPLAPDWTTESDRCEEREPSAPTLFYVLVQSRRMSLRGETGPVTESHPQWLDWVIRGVHPCTPPQWMDWSIHRVYTRWILCTYMPTHVCALSWPYPAELNQCNCIHPRATTCIPPTSRNSTILWEFLRIN